MARGGCLFPKCVHLGEWRTFEVRELVEAPRERDGLDIRLTYTESLVSKRVLNPDVAELNACPLGYTQHGP